MFRFSNTNSPAIELSLSDALDKVMDLSNKLRDDEEHVIQTLVKYVQDKNFQKELRVYTIHKYSPVNSIIIS